MVDRILDAVKVYNDFVSERINNCPICSDKLGITLFTITNLTRENLEKLAAKDLDSIMAWLNDIEGNAIQRLRSVRSLQNEQTWNDYQYIWDDIKSCRECTLLKDALEFAKLYMRNHRHQLTFVKSMQQRIREVKRESQS